MTKPKISVCATCYNHERFIPEFMDSVLSQTMPDWELNVVDDCSTDGSFALLQQYAAKDPRIHVVQNDRNRHVCHSGNRSMSMATADLVTGISCDDLFVENKLECDVAYMLSNPSVGALYTYPIVVLKDGSRGRDLDRARDFSRLALLHDELFGRNMITVPGMTIRRNLWNEVGGYNPLLRMSQDHELHIKVLKRAEVALSDVSTVKYRRHDANLSSGDARYIHALMNESIWFLSEHYLDGLRSVDEMKAIVPEWQKYGKPIMEIIPYFLARHALETGTEPEVRVAGLTALFRFMSDKKNCQLLEQQCDFLPKDLMLMAELPTVAAMKDLAQAQESLRLMERSVSYRLGLALTWPLRKFYRMAKPLEGGK